MDPYNVDDGEGMPQSRGMQDINDLLGLVNRDTKLGIAAAMNMNGNNCDNDFSPVAIMDSTMSGHNNDNNQLVLDDSIQREIQSRVEQQLEHQMREFNEKCNVILIKIPMLESKTEEIEGLRRELEEEKEKNKLNERNFRDCITEVTEKLTEEIVELGVKNIDLEGKLTELEKRLEESVSKFQLNSEATAVAPATRSSDQELKVIEANVVKLEGRIKAIEKGKKDSSTAAPPQHVMDMMFDLSKSMEAKFQEFGDSQTGKLIVLEERLGEMERRKEPKQPQSSNRGNEAVQMVLELSTDLQSKFKKLQEGQSSKTSGLEERLSGMEKRKERLMDCFKRDLKSQGEQQQTKIQELAEGQKAKLKVLEGRIAEIERRKDGQDENFKRDLKIHTVQQELKIQELAKGQTDKVTGVEKRLEGVEKKREQLQKEVKSQGDVLTKVQEASKSQSAKVSLVEGRIKKMEHEVVEMIAELRTSFQAFGEDKAANLVLLEDKIGEIEKWKASEDSSSKDSRLALEKINELDKKFQTKLTKLEEGQTGKITRLEERIGNIEKLKTTELPLQFPQPSKSSAVGVDDDKINDLDKKLQNFEECQSTRLTNLEEKIKIIEKWKSIEESQKRSGLVLDKLSELDKKVQLNVQKLEGVRTSTELRERIDEIEKWKFDEQLRNSQSKPILEKMTQLEENVRINFEEMEKNQTSKITSLEGKIREIGKRKEEEEQAHGKKILEKVTGLERKIADVERWKAVEQSPKTTNSTTIENTIMLERTVQSKFEEFGKGHSTRVTELEKMVGEIVQQKCEEKVQGNQILEKVTGLQTKIQEVKDGHMGQITALENRMAEAEKGTRMLNGLIADLGKEMTNKWKELDERAKVLTERIGDIEVWKGSEQYRSKAAEIETVRLINEVQQTIHELKVNQAGFQGTVEVNLKEAVEKWEGKLKKIELELIMMLARVEKIEEGQRRMEQDKPDDSTMDKLRNGSEPVSNSGNDDGTKAEVVVVGSASQSKSPKRLIKIERTRDTCVSPPTDDDAFLELDDGHPATSECPDGTPEDIHHSDEEMEPSSVIIHSRKRVITPEQEGKDGGADRGCLKKLRSSLRRGTSPRGKPTSNTASSSKLDQTEKDDDKEASGGSESGVTTRKSSTLSHGRDLSNPFEFICLCGYSFLRMGDFDKHLQQTKITTPSAKKSPRNYKSETVPNPVFESERPQSPLLQDSRASRMLRKSLEASKKRNAKLGNSSISSQLLDTSSIKMEVVDLSEPSPGTSQSTQEEGGGRVLRSGRRDASSSRERVLNSPARSNHGNNHESDADHNSLRRLSIKVEKMDTNLLAPPAEDHHNMASPSPQRRSLRRRNHSESQTQNQSQAADNLSPATSSQVRLLRRSTATRTPCNPPSSSPEVSGSPVSHGERSRRTSGHPGIKLEENDTAPMQSTSDSNTTTTNPTRQLRNTPKSSKPSSSRDGVKHGKSRYRPLACLCGKLFAESNSFANHLRSHSNNSKQRKFTCTSCRQEFVFAYQLNIHSQRAHRRNNNSSSIPSTSTTNKSPQERPKVKEEPADEQPPTAEVPEEKKPVVHGAGRKIFEHGRKRFYCKCGKVFTSKKTQNVHIAQNTGQGTQFLCNLCPRQFLFNSMLCWHLKNVHKVGGGKVNGQPTCSSCAKTFRSRKALVRHHCSGVHKK